METTKALRAAVVLILTVFAAYQPCSSQSSGNPLQDLWENLQQLADPDDGDFPYADIIQADPVSIGTVYAGKVGAVYKTFWQPAGTHSIEARSTTIVINGRNAIIQIDQNRSDARVAGYSFQFEITELKNQNGVLFTKAHAWDVWPVLKIITAGNTVSTQFDVGEATEVTGLIHASTISQPGFPSVRCADASFSVLVERDSLCRAIGSFTIPFFPVSILYAPSPGEEGKTKVKYLDEHAVTTKVTTSILDEQSQTVPVNYSGRPSLKTVMEGLKAVGTVTGMLNPAAGAIIVKCVDIMSSALGTFEESEESGTKSQTAEGALLLTSSSIGQTVGGQNDDGAVAQPGQDDRIVILRGLHMAWIGNGADNPVLVPLNIRQFETLPLKKIANDIAYLEAAQPPEPPAVPADSGHVGDLEFGQQPAPAQPGKTPVKARPLDSRTIARIHSALKDHLVPDDQLTDIGNLETLRSLYAMDPLAFFGPEVDLESEEVKQHYGDRFQVAYFITQWGEAEELNTEFPTDYETVSLSTFTNATSGTQFQTFIEDDKPGWFGKYFLGYETKKVKTSSTISTSSETAVTNSRKVSLHWERSSEDVVLRAYYDCLFGTYIFREVGNVYLQTTDIATDSKGHALPNQMLLLEINGKSVLAQTDDEGRYRIFSSNPHIGRGKITVGETVKTMRIAPSKKKLR
jgi:hypothetical protein